MISCPTALPEPPGCVLQLSEQFPYMLDAYDLAPQEHRALVTRTMAQQIGIPASETGAVADYVAAFSVIRCRARSDELWQGADPTLVDQVVTFLAVGRYQPPLPVSTGTEQLLLILSQRYERGQDGFRTWFEEEMAKRRCRAAFDANFCDQVEFEYGRLRPNAAQFASIGADPGDALRFKRYQCACAQAGTSLLGSFL